MDGSIYDQLAAELGIKPSPPPGGDSDATRPLPVVRRPPNRPPPPPRPPAPYPAWVVQGHPFLDLHHRLTHLERMIMSALDNANEQLASLQQTIATTIVPNLQALGAAAAASGTVTGVPEEAVQALADGISAATSQLAQAAQAAVAQIPQG